MPFGRDEVVDAIEQRGMAAGPHLGIAEFAHFAQLHLAAQLFGHGLHAVADAQHRHAGFKYCRRNARRIALDHRIRPARKDDAGGAVIAHEVIINVIRINFRKYAAIAHAARNQLSNLGAEIKDQNLGMHALFLVEFLWNALIQRGSSVLPW